MARISAYPKHIPVQPEDYWIGTRASNLLTRNFTAKAVGEYINVSGSISMATCMLFKFKVTNAGPGDVTGVPNETLFSNITSLQINTLDVSDQDTVGFLEYIVGTEIIISEQNKISTFGHYTIDSYTKIEDTAFYTMNLTYIGGNGFIEHDIQYNICSFVLSDTDTTYTLDSVQNGPNSDIRLRGSDSTENIVKLEAGTNVTLTDTGSNILVDVTGLGTVTSVDASIDGNSLSVAGVPITSSGTIAFNWQGTNLQYVDGEGNLQTFPTIPTGTVTSVSQTHAGNAFSVTGSPITTSGVLAITLNGDATQYIDGAGDLQTFPAIPNVGDGTLTVQGTGVLDGTGTFTANQAGDTTISITHGNQSQANTTPETTLTHGGTFTALSANVSVNASGHVIGQELTTFTLPSDSQGVTSVNFTTDGTALNVVSNTVTTSGTMTGIWQGNASQYVNGEGDLQTFPTIPVVPTNIVETIDTTNGTYINLTPTTPTTGDVIITADLSAVDGTGAPAGERYLSKNNKWETISSIPGTYEFSVDSNNGPGATIIESGDTFEVSGGTYLTGTLSVAADVKTIDIDHDLTSRTDTTSSDSPSYGGSFQAVKSVTTNATGHVTSIDVSTVTLPTSDDTTYDLTVPLGTTDITLLGSDASSDQVTLTGGTNITVTRVSATELSIDGTDLNTTYNLEGVGSVNGTAGVRLAGSDATNDDVLIVGAGTTTVTRSLNTLTVTSNDEFTGTVTSVDSSITGNAVSVSGVPFTISGSIDFDWNGTNLDYVDGEGNLQTFPTIPTVPTNIVETFSNNNTGTYVAYGVTNTGATGNINIGNVDLTATDGTAIPGERYLTKSNTWAEVATIPGTYTFNVSDGGTSTTINSGDTVNLLGGTYITTSNVSSNVTITHNPTSRTDTASTDSPGVGGSFTAVDSVTTNATGHVEAINLKSVTLPTASLSSEVVDIQVKNISAANGGINLKKGDPVYIYGSVGASARLYVDLADSDSTATNNLGDNKMPCVGLLDQDLDPNEEGTATVVGKLRNLITSPIDGATPNENDTVYVKSGGGLTLTKPAGSANLIQNVGQVGRVSTSADGNIVVAALLRSNDVPNLPTGRLFVGTATNTSLVSDVVYVDDANDRVGIGTNNPSYQLQVTGNNSNSPLFQVDDSSDPYLQIKPDSTTFFKIGDIGGLGNEAFIEGNYFDLKFNVAGNTTMTLEGNNRVGIGITNPSQKLHVDGNARVTGAYYDSNNDPGTSGQILSSTVTGTDWIDGSAIPGVPAGSGTLNYLARWTPDNDTLGIGVTYDNGTNVGIGTTNPTALLTLESNSTSPYPGIDIKSTSTYPSGKIRFLDSSGSEVSTIESWSNPAISYLKLHHGYTAAFSSTLTLDDGFLYLSTAGSERMRITSSGNVGIGTTSPSEKLVIKDSTSNAGVKILSYNNAIGTEATLKFATVASDANYEKAAIITRNYASSFGRSDMHFALDSAADSGNVQFSDTKMTILNNGNVGIGTTNPQAKLHVANGTLRTWTPTTGTSAIFESTVSNRNFLTLTAANEAELWFGDASTQAKGRVRYEMFTNDMEFWTNGTQKMVINTSGNVGIGTTSPTSAKLVVAGDVDVWNSTNTLLRSSHNGSYGSFQTFTSGLYGILALNPGGGNVGIGTTNPSYKLQLSSNSAAKPSSSLWTVVSDFRVKENIRDYTTGLEAILKIEPKIYDYNGKAGFEKTKDNIGIIAQDMQNVMPETIKTYNTKLNEDDTEDTELLNFDGHAVTFALINAVKDLKAEIEELKKQINK